MKIVVNNGMVDISSEDISYGNIREMYLAGDGSGLQVSRKVDGRKEDIEKMCDIISRNIYQLQDLLEGA